MDRPRVDVELEIPDQLRDAMIGCELYCEAACCGERAFELLPENLEPWVARATDADVDLVLQQADQLIEQLSSLGPTAGLKWFSGDDPAGPKSWLEDFRECFVEATRPPTHGSDGAAIVRRASARVAALADKMYLGVDYWSDPLVSGWMSVLLPDRPLEVQMKLAVERLAPGDECAAEFRFPLPQRIQAWLQPGRTLPLGSRFGAKNAEMTLTASLE